MHPLIRDCPFAQMSSPNLMDPTPSPANYSQLDRVLLDEVRIRRRVAEMGRQITAEYEGQALTVVTILQGGAVFMADLIREIHLPMKLESISVASYHGGTESSGTVTFLQSELPDIDGRDVILLDDILDSGRTLAAIRHRFETEKKPASVRVCVFLEKNIPRAAEVVADYRGFLIEDLFVVGYGLDYQGEHRNLPVVGTLRPELIEK